MPESLLAAIATRDEPFPSLPEIAFPKEIKMVNLLDGILGKEQLDQFGSEAREDKIKVIKETQKTLKGLVEATKQRSASHYI
jgi:hypothetical protein